MGDGGRNPAGPISRGVDAEPPPSVLSGEFPMGVVEDADPALVDGEVSRLRLTTERALVVASSSTSVTKVDEATPAAATAQPATTATGIVLPALAGRRISAFTARETGGAAATFTLYAGVNNAAPIIAYVQLNANQRMGGDWGGEQIDIAAGLFLELHAGAIAFVPMVKVVT